MNIDKHNITDHPLYKIYKTIKNRCYNKSTNGWSYYGARGVTMCDRWRFGENGVNGFWNFVEDMGDRPPGTSIDKAKDALVYCKENCRWATRDEQTKNRTGRVGDRPELVGRKIGTHTVVGLTGTSRNGNRLWNCICECGNVVQITTEAVNKFRIAKCKPDIHYRNVQQP